MAAARAGKWQKGCAIDSYLPSPCMCMYGMCVCVYSECVCLSRSEQLGEILKPTRCQGNLLANNMGQLSSSDWLKCCVRKFSNFQCAFGALRQGKVPRADAAAAATRVNHFAVSLLQVFTVVAYFMPCLRYSFVFFSSFLAFYDCAKCFLAQKVCTCLEFLRQCPWNRLLKQKHTNWGRQGHSKERRRGSVNEVRFYVRIFYLVSTVRDACQQLQCTSKLHDSEFLLSSVYLDCSSPPALDPPFTTEPPSVG